MGQGSQNCGLTFPLTLKFGGEGKVLKRGNWLLFTQVVLNLTQIPTHPQEMFTHTDYAKCAFYTLSRSHACVKYTHSDSC